MANVKFKRLLTSELVSEAIEDGKTIWIKDGNNGLYMDVGTTREQMIATDTALSTTSTNPIQNQALTNSIVNDLATAIATTADRIPCGTKPVKELNEKVDRNSFYKDGYITSGPLSQVIIDRNYICTFSIKGAADLPNTTDEFTIFTYGQTIDGIRLTVLCSVFNGTGLYMRHMLNNSWISGWIQIH